MSGAGDAGAPGWISSRLVHDGRVVHLSVDTVRYPDGTVGELELIRHSGAAAVLPVLGDPSDGDPEVVLIRQYRYAAGGYLLEVPAGRPSRQGEPWEECARRELEEETGLVAERLHPLTSIFTTPGFTDERIHLFLATGVSAGRHGGHDADEFIEVVNVRFSQAVRWARQGEISDAKTLCTLFAAEGVLAEWRRGGIPGK